MKGRRSPPWGLSPKVISRRRVCNGNRTGGAIFAADNKSLGFPDYSGVVDDARSQILGMLGSDVYGDVLVSSQRAVAVDKFIAAFLNEVAEPLGLTPDQFE